MSPVLRMHQLPSFLQLKGLVTHVAAALGIVCSPALAEPIFTQTTTNPGAFDGTWGSDRDEGDQFADDFMVSSPATIQSVTWWGIYTAIGSDASPQGPWSFELIFYGDIGGLPDPSNVIGSTQVVFETLTDTGRNLGDDLFEDDIYVFTADVTPISVSAGTTYWLSVVADTSNDPINTFGWRRVQNGNAANRSGNDGVFTGPFRTRSFYGGMVFRLDGSLISEPEPPSIDMDFVDGQIEIEFSGILQSSADLIEWDDVNPQPAAPYRFTPSQAKRFFRARTE